MPAVLVRPRFCRIICKTEAGVYSRLAVAALFALVIMPALAFAVDYDAASGRLSVQIEDEPVTPLLGRISVLSGVEIRMPPREGQTLSLSLDGVTLEVALARVARQLQLSHVFSHRRDEHGELVLVTAWLLPEGQAPGGDVPAVISPERESAARTIIMQRYRDRGVAEADIPEAVRIAEKRWQARLEAMDPDQREQVLERRQQVMQERQAVQEDLDARREQLREQREDRAREYEALRETDPERWEQRRQAEEAQRRRMEERYAE